MILAALYLLWAYQRVFHGEPDEENAAMPDLSWREGLVMAPLLGLIVFLGVYPQPMLDRIEPSVDRLVTHIEDNSDYVEPEVATTGAGDAAEGEHEDEDEEEARAVSRSSPILSQPIEQDPVPIDGVDVAWSAARPDAHPRSAARCCSSPPTRCPPASR